MIGLGVGLILILVLIYFLNTLENSKRDRDEEMRGPVIPGVEFMDLTDKENKAFRYVVCGPRDKSLGIEVALYGWMEKWGCRGMRRRIWHLEVSELLGRY